MSGNQLIHPLQFATPGARLSEDLPHRPKQHGCTTCTYWGGVGHTLTELLKIANREQEIADEQPVQPFRRTCGYWSARNRAYCGSTDKVEVHGAIGSRCVHHHPDVMDAVYRAVVEAK